MRALTSLERESDVQRDVIACYTACTCQVIRFSEGRRSRVTPGWPDLAVFCTGKRTMWLHETKRLGGRQSAQQSSMQELAAACGVTYVLGGLAEAMGHLRAIGLVQEP